MKFSFMRFADKYIGKIIIMMLVIHNFFIKKILFKKKNVPKKTDHILIIKFFGIGSIVNSIPMIQRLRKEYPSAKILYLTFTSNKSIINISNIADEVIAIDQDSFLSFFLGNLRVLYFFLFNKIDIAIDLEFFSKYSMLMSYLSGAVSRVGFFSSFNIRTDLLTHPINYNHYKHIARNYLAMIEAIGVDVDKTKLDFQLPTMNSNYQAILQDLLGLKNDQKIVTININASKLCTLRKWSEEKYVNLLAEMAIKYPDYLYVLIGSEDEYADVESLYLKSTKNMNGNLINLAGKTDIYLLLTLLERTQIFISTDSGPAHLAAGYKTNSIVLFGPETPVLYKPLNPNARTLYKELYCSPCINVLDNKSFLHCTNVKCMDQIGIEEIMNIFEGFIRN